MKYDLIPFLLLMGLLLKAQSQPPSPLLNSFEHYLDDKANSTLGLEWISLGPVVNSARVEAVQLDPNQPGTMYVAFGSGNLWKTTNHGLSWKPIFENQAALGIGDFALAPSNPDIIYVGTGESLKKPRNFTMPGTGVYRSDDAGQTWRHLGLADSWHIGEVIVHPENPDMVYVAVLGHFWTANPNRGIYRSIDGGHTWEHVLYIDEQTGANDIVIAPSNPDILYASMWENYPGTYGPNSGIYKSEDRGETWNKMERGLPQGPKLGRIGVAVSHANADKAYAFVDNLNLDSTQSGEIYKTMDGGLSWFKTHQDPLYFLSRIGWYFMDLYTNPRDDEELFALGVRLGHSKDGGQTFDLMGGEVHHMNPSMAQTLHLDHCEMYINPQNPNHLALGNDGGLYISYDKGQTWMHYNNIPAGEFYQMAISEDTPYTIYGGTQDDATVFGPGTPFKNNYPDSWKYLWIDAWSGGDGCFTQLDPEDPNTLYFSMQHGAFRRKDIAMDTSISIRPEHPDSVTAFQFVAPYLVSKYDPHTLYAAGNYIFKSTDRGDHWRVISPDLTQTQLPQKASVAAGALAESPLEKGTLYVGTEKGAFWASQDDGKHWSENDHGIADAYIRSICPSQHAYGRVYVTMTGINDDDLNGYMYASQDHGQTWTAIHTGLPNEPANVILEDPHFENMLYAGLYRGVYVSMDHGESWELLGPNLPGVSIGDMKLHHGTNDLVVATHGRGFYKINVNPIYEMQQDDWSADEIMLLQIPPVKAPQKRDTHQDIDLQSLEDVILTYYLPKPGQVTIQLFNEKETPIFTFQEEGKQGLNQWVWDMVLAESKSDQPYFIHDKQYLSEGQYLVKIWFDQKEVEQILKVVR